MAEVTDLYASLGLRVDKGAWAKGDAALKGAKRAVDQLNGAFQDRQGRWRAASGRFLTMGEKAKLAAKGVKGVGEESERSGKKARDSWTSAGMALRGYVGYLGGRAAYGALVGFNSTVEDTKLQIAGMFALTKKTDLVDQLATADKLYASLQKRAMTLPGTTAEYVAMAGKLTRVITDSGGSVKDLENLTVNALIATKGLGENWEVAARDIEQALMGRYNTVDPFLSKILPSIGYKGEEGRDKWRALSQKKRFTEMQRALMQKQIGQLGEAQGKTFSGRLSTFKDTLQQTAGEAGKGLFNQLAESLKYVNEWLEKNKEAIKEVASTLGGALLVALDMAKHAFDILVEGIKFFVEHSTLAQVALIALGAVLTAFAIRAAAAWVMALGPVGLLIAAVVGVIAVVGLLRKHWDKIGGAFKTAGRAIAGAFGWLADKIKGIVKRVGEFFTDDIPAAIKAAFEWLSDLPIIGRLFRLVGELRNLGSTGAASGYVEEIGKLSSPDQHVISSGVARGGTTVGKIDVSVGDINVNAPNADPAAVADHVRNEVRDQLGGMLLRTMDEQ